MINNLDFENDELKVYRGNDFVICKELSIKQPSLGEICDYGEQKYFSLIFNICATPSDYKYPLFEMGYDWETLSEFYFFLMNVKKYSKKDTSIVFGDFDINKFNIAIDDKTQEIYLCDTKNGTIFSIDFYEKLVTYIRNVHAIKKNTEKALNKTTKNILLEESKMLFLKKNNKFKSILKPLISSLTNCGEFKYNHSNVWDMKINAFMDSVSRIQVRDNYKNIMQAVYSGTIDFNKVKKETNWLREIIL